MISLARIPQPRQATAGQTSAPAIKKKVPERVRRAAAIRKRLDVLEARAFHCKANVRLHLSASRHDEAVHGMQLRARTAEASEEINRSSRQLHWHSGHGFVLAVARVSLRRNASARAKTQCEHFIENGTTQPPHRQTIRHAEKYERARAQAQTSSTQPQAPPRSEKDTDIQSSPHPATRKTT